MTKHFTVKFHQTELNTFETMEIKIAKSKGTFFQIIDTCKEGL